MALIIKGKMPTCCGSCDASGTGACKAWMGYRKHLNEGIPSDCPIVGEIPNKHGRLIDADALFQTYDGFSEDYYERLGEIRDTIINAQTIVEASNGDTD